MVQRQHPSQHDEGDGNAKCATGSDARAKLLDDLWHYYRNGKGPDELGLGKLYLGLKTSTFLQSEFVLYQKNKSTPCTTGAHLEDPKVVPGVRGSENGVYGSKERSHLTGTDGSSTTSYDARLKDDRLKGTRIKDTIQTDRQGKLTDRETIFENDTPGGIIRKAIIGEGVDGKWMAIEGSVGFNGEEVSADVTKIHTKLEDGVYERDIESAAGTFTQRLSPDGKVVSTTQTFIGTPMAMKIKGGSALINVRSVTRASADGHHQITTYTTEEGRTITVTW